MILITGAAGFIGAHAVKRLLDEGKTVVGIDNLNDYYSVKLKIDRLKLLNHKNFIFEKADRTDEKRMEQLFHKYKPAVVIDIAAQAGVRYSLENPHAYIKSNIEGFINIIEACRKHKIKHLIYASSSSVYGANTKLPFSEKDYTSHPVSLYAATKKANELIAHTYSHLYGLPTTGLRFFTVYGPWGRPDMAYFQFTKAILEEKPIQIFNNGNMKRDFTYIDDVTEAIVRLIDRKPSPDPSWDGSKPNPGTSYVPYRVYNIGGNSPVSLQEFIRTIEEKAEKKAIKEYMPMQSGDVVETAADISELTKDIGYNPDTPLDKGIEAFVTWYKNYYGV